LGTTEEKEVEKTTPTEPEDDDAIIEVSCAFVYTNIFSTGTG
jgi:hypothetical protein